MQGGNEFRDGNEGGERTMQGGNEFRDGSEGER